MIEEEKLFKHLTARSAQLSNNTRYLNAAVTVPLIRKDGVLSVLFEVRSSDLTWQPGDICFPGGRIENSDASPLGAALRETSEELGIDPGGIKVLGALDFLTSSIGVLLYPFVVELPPDTPLRPSREEVSELFAAPLEQLLQINPTTAQMQLFTRPQESFPFHFFKYDYPRDYKPRGSYPVLFYQYGDYLIWGLTAQVLSDFLKIYRKIL